MGPPPSEMPLEHIIVTRGLIWQGDKDGTLLLIRQAPIESESGKLLGYESRPYTGAYKGGGILQGQVLPGESGQDRAFAYLNEMQFE